MNRPQLEIFIWSFIIILTFWHCYPYKLTLKLYATTKRLKYAKPLNSSNTKYAKIYIIQQNYK